MKRSLFILLIVLRTLATFRADGRLLDQALAAHCPISGCKIESNSNITHLNVSLIGLGFHRGLEITASLVGSTRVATVAILLDLPSAIYANAYELDNAALRNRGPRVKVFGNVDVESIQQFAQPTALAVYTNLSQSLQPLQPESESEQGWSNTIRMVHVHLPLHARYPTMPPPVTGASLPFDWNWFTSPQTIVTIPSPLILARTTLESDWMIVEHKHEVSCTWSLPAGNVLHTRFVIVTTVVVVIVSALLIIHSVFRY
jgi:hypothetical protein